MRRVELTTSNACTKQTEDCKCQAGESPKDLIVCDGNAVQGLMEVEVLSLPPYINAIRILNASQATFKRGAIRISGDKRFSISISNVKNTQMDGKSLTLLDAKSKLQINVEDVEDLQLENRFVSAKKGIVEVTLNKVDTVSVESQAFDVLDKIIIKNVGVLHLEQLSFKPNVLPSSQQPEFIAEFTKIRYIASIPSDSFPSAARIKFSSCNISDLETNAFSGNQMTDLTFNNTAIDRIHTHAFPEKSVIVNLQFISCVLSSISQKAVASGISSLDIRHSRIISISPEAFNCPVAKVILYENIFSTISRHTFLFESSMLSNLTIDMNQFKFVESGAFAKISASDPNVKFSFKGNHIHYANKNALSLYGLPNNIIANVNDNVFHKECDCEYQNWLDEVCSEETSQNVPMLDFRGLIKNTSYCTVPDLAMDCFEHKKFVSIAAYIKLSCVNEYNIMSIDTTCMKSASTVWDHFQEQIEVTTNKGILLIVLLFVLASSLVVGIVTLLRWLVYSFQTRGKYSDHDEEWNFTKVEERLIPHEEEANNSPSSFNGSLTQHYESLPLTTTEVLMESTPSSSPIKIKVETMCKDPKSNTSSHKSTKGNRLSETDASEHTELKEQLLTASSTDGENNESSKSNIPKSSATTPDTEKGDDTWKRNSSNTPKQSFFDEMIGLLTEKLDDPDNYGTVLDTRNKSSENTPQMLYQDPISLKADT